MRAFAGTKQVYDKAAKVTDLPQSKMLDLVIEIDFEAAGADTGEEP